MIKEIVSLCKCGVAVNVNEHRDVYEDVATYLHNESSHLPADTLAMMVETDTVVEVYAHINTPVGFLKVIHWDIDAALKEMLEAIKEYHANKQR